MPTVAQQFFFGTIDDDQDIPGVAESVKKLQESAPANNTATSVTWSTTTIVEKTLIPLVGNTNSGDTTTTNAWAINEAGADGMGSVTGALRRIPAGVWGFSLQMALNTAALLDTHALTLKANVYRLADINAGAGGARSLLFSATSPNQTGSATVMWNSASQPEVLLQPGETIMVGLTATSASTTALVLGANTNTVMTVTLGANSHVTVPAPGIETIAKGVGTAAGSSSADGVLAGTGAMVGTSDGVATVSGALSATGAMVGASNGSAVVSGAASAVAVASGLASGSSTADGALAGVGAMVGSSDGSSTAAASGATVSATVGSSAGSAAVAGAIAGVGSMVGSSDGSSTASGSMGAVSEGSGFAAGSSTASGSMAAVAPAVGTVNVADGGSGTVIVRRKRVIMFDKA